MSCYLDHITITAPNLNIGLEYVRATLGVTPQIGGKHPKMSTHNYLLKLGDSVFLEIISPDPNAPKPERPRWFELDELEPTTQPKLATWVVRTADIRDTLAKCSESLGNVEPMSRGDLNWLITIPPDGSLPLDGIAPTLIEWKTDVHPASKLQDTGCTMLGLEAFHPDAERISALLKSIGFEGDYSVFPISKGERPYMVAHINTPRGRMQLSVPNPTLK